MEPYKCEYVYKHEMQSMQTVNRFCDDLKTENIFNTMPAHFYTLESIHIHAQDIDISSYINKTIHSNLKHLYFNLFKSCRKYPRHQIS